ncbi:hypothetical protein PCK1_001684 [Pneumocystis canis]|nr:hypothetical protein PCK1_001684 [Pneumocystis canis]
MHRWFGLQKGASSETMLNDMTDERIKRCENKLHECEESLKRIAQSRHHQTHTTGIKMKAQMLLRQKKMYEEQLEILQGQQMNMEQIAWTTDQVDMTRKMMKTMKHADRVFRQRPLSLDEIEQLQDTIEDSLAQTDEIQRMLARPYNMNELDEFDLDAELDALEELHGLADEDKQNEIPDYLTAPTELNILNTLAAPSASVKPSQEDAQAAIYTNS